MMLTLIEDYEQCRFQLQKRICELNKTLRTASLQTMEREKMIARKDMLTKERHELLESILEMKQHLRKEEIPHDETSSGIRS